MTSPSSSAIAGFHLVEQKKTHDPTIEKMDGNTRWCCVRLVHSSNSMKEHVSGLPTVVGFAAVEVLEDDDRVYLLYPGIS